MGYEIKLHIGQISSVDQKTFLEIATVDLSKIGSGPLNHLIQFAKGKSAPVEFKDFKFHLYYDSWKQWLDASYWNVELENENK